MNRLPLYDLYHREVGRWIIPYSDISIGTYSKPNAIRRFLAWAVMGMIWEPHIEPF